MKKKKINKKSKKILIIVAIILISIVILNVIINILKKSSKNNDTQIVNTSGFKTVEDVLNYYGCEFIKEIKSKDSNYSKDIYLEFKYNTFEDDRSNQRFYENVIANVANILQTNYRLIDESKDLLIEVKRYTNSEGILKYFYIINGEENYFVNQESKNSLKNYKEDTLTNLEINSNIINNLIQNKWKPNVNFGTKDSTFENYDIYFDEGIEVRKISEKIYNIVFTNKNQEEIVNGIKVGTSFEEIIQKLGEPIFGDKQGQCIGYRNNDIYVFFSEEEISIYRYEEYNTKKFEELLSKYINNEIDIKEFMNELTYLWDDYSEYTYDSNYIFIRYPLQGLEITMTSDDSKGIQIYENYSNISNIEEYIKNNQITGNFEEDLVYIEELSRNNSKLDQFYLISLQSDYDVITSESSLYGYYTNENEVKFISKDEKRPNQTFTENINTAFWYSDTKFIYSVKNQGIYLYDLESKSKITVVEGNEDYTFEKYEDGILTYDEGKTIQISN